MALTEHNHNPIEDVLCEYSGSIRRYSLLLSHAELYIEIVSFKETSLYMYIVYILAYLMADVLDYGFGNRYTFCC